MDTPLPLAAAIDLQDHLLAADHDLERLLALIDDCHATLQAGFFGALESAQALPAEHAAAVQSALMGAVKGLQFQDMSSQLIGHTRRRLRGSAERLARSVFADDDDDAATAVDDETPQRPNPVAQSAMNTGFVELF